MFITGSADGLGLMAAQLLVKEGHRVVLHARNESRAKAALAAEPGAETAVTGDLSSISETKNLAPKRRPGWQLAMSLHHWLPANIFTTRN
jgi:NAD(P)-dependent dehydrogenase (short-subunit alcohol dehydrogenase family)